MADFRGLRINPPKGMKVLQADHELHLYRFRDHRIFIIREDKGIFTLSEKTAEFAESFMLSTDSMYRVLRCVGYGSIPKAVTEQKPIENDEIEF